MSLHDALGTTACQRGTSAAPLRQRSDVEVAAQQLRAIDAFNRARHMREQAAAAAARSREMRLDAARSMEVLRRQHAAVVKRSHEHLEASGQLLRTTAERRAVLAHRNDWLVGSLTRTLESHGVRVAAGTDNGAVAVGLVVAEQPDLGLVDYTLAMVAGVEVVCEVRRFSPDTVVAAQAADGYRVVQLLDAGATTVFPCHISPADMAQSLLDLVGAA